MMKGVLHKVLLQYNINNLREIDDDAIDDDVSFLLYSLSSGYLFYQIWMIF